MIKHDVFYVNHKLKKRTIEDLGSGITLVKVGDIPRSTFVWIKYIEEEDRQPFFLLIPRTEHMGTKDRRGRIFINELNMEGWEYLNKRIKEKRRKGNTK